MTGEQETKNAEMSEAVRLIITTRERTPRNPRWAESWRRTLFRYLGDLRNVHANRSSEQETEKGED